jgi:hypothetical protein
MRRATVIASLIALAAVACGSSESPATSNVGGSGASGGHAGAAGTGGAGGQDPQDGGDAGSDDAPTCESAGTVAQPFASDPLAAIITSDSLAPAFDAYAQLHTLLGIPTRVVTTSEICAGPCDDADPTRDTAALIKQWILGQPSLRYVILGGDIEHVPSRKVHDRYQNPILVGYTFEDDFFTDYYYADLSPWDGNGDGVYAQDGVDFPDYRPEIAVSRISASTPDEASRYLEKVRRYLTAYDTSHVGKVLLLSNVATQFASFDIDGAWYFEAEGRTLSLLPPGSEVRRLYSTAMAGAEKNSVVKQIAAIESGYNLVVHSGHGAVKYLTAEYSVSDDMSGAMAHALENATYPIFLSSACEAGTFAADDSAGEMLMDAPEGGAIVYLGNTVTGLGLAGGMQMIDELLRYVQATPHPLLADAVRVAHENMPEQDTFRIPFVNYDAPVVDRSSYEWTQKSVTLLGDILIPVWKGIVEPAATVTASARPTCEGTWIDLAFQPPLVGVARVQAGTSTFEVQVVQGNAQLHVPGSPSTVTVGLAVPGRLATFADLAL